MLSFWDRLFGSFRRRDDQDNIKLGLDDFQHPEQHTLTGMLVTPLKEGRRNKPGHQPG
ncbi:MAG: hypothetical protein H7Y43_13405 [Akkermansiaceae bacterium]|nr:hypothetical protein [Verrucomicrobiales bacterium]